MNVFVEMLIYAAATEFLERSERYMREHWRALLLDGHLVMVPMVNAAEAVRIGLLHSSA